MVLDDDPTGSQAVSGVRLLLTWTPEDLRWALTQDSAPVFIQMNTRSLQPDEVIDTVKPRAESPPMTSHDTDCTSPDQS